jgi:hypothetical protein
MIVNTVFDTDLCLRLQDDTRIKTGDIAVSCLKLCYEVTDRNDSEDNDIRNEENDRWSRHNIIVSSL